MVPELVPQFRPLREWETKVCRNLYSEHEITKFLLDYLDAHVVITEGVSTDTAYYITRWCFMLVACAIGAFGVLKVKFPAQQTQLLACIAGFFACMGALQLMDTYWVKLNCLSFIEGSDNHRYCIEPTIDKKRNNISLAMRRVCKESEPDVKIINYLGRYFHENGTLHQLTILKDFNTLRNMAVLKKPKETLLDYSAEGLKAALEEKHRD